MKLNCSQFEGLITFYIDGDISKTLKQAFEEHMEYCPACKIKFNIIKSMVEDIKCAYKKLSENNNDYTEVKMKNNTNYSENITPTELSAYIDNELSDESNIKMRRNIIAKPQIRTKIEKLYKLRKLLFDSYSEHKNKLRTDYSKDIIRCTKNEITEKQLCLHCLLFIFIVAMAVTLSVLAIISVL